MIIDSVIKNWTIYKITNPIGQIYIGKTSNYKRRIDSYKGLDFKTKTRLYFSLQEYGYKNHKFEIIDSFVANISFSDDKEMFWIKTYMSNYHKYKEQNGLNSCDGGGLVKGLKMSDETKEKMRAKKAHKNIPILQFDLNGNLIKEYSSISEAAKETNSRKHLIKYVARGVLKKTNNYIFKYK